MDLQEIQQLQGDLQDVLEMLGLGYVQPNIEVDETSTVKVELTPNGEQEQNLGILIGNHGATLFAFEYLTALMINRDREEWLHVHVDLDGYRKKRRDELIGLANKMAEKAQFLNEVVELRPMAAPDRRIIHMALADIPGVVTESVGEGRGRYVVIKPA